VPTATTLPLIILIALLWRLTKGNVLSVVLFTSIFDAASALNFGKLGVSPWMVALLVGLAEKVLKGHGPFRLITGINQLALKLGVSFVLYSAWSGIVFPVIFAGAPVLSSHDTSPAPLNWNVSNFAQLCYLVACVLVYFVALTSTREELRSALQWYSRGAVTAAVFAFYQLANAVFHVPYPSPILYSHPGHVIYPAYMIRGMWRLNGTFPEASELATYACLGVALLGWDVVTRRFNLPRTVGLGLLIASVFMTLSTVGYLCLSTIVVTGSVLSLSLVFRQRSFSPQKILMALLLVGGGVTLFLTTDARGTVNKVVSSVVLEKKDTSSYRDRSAMNSAAIDTLKDTYFMGAGWGSARASGLIYGLLANVGVIGVALLAAMLLTICLPLVYSHGSFVHPESAKTYVKSLFGLMSMLTALLIAGAEPVEPVLWALIAIATAAYARGPSNEVAPIPVTDGRAHFPIALGLS